MTYDVELLDAVTEAMKEPVLSAELQIERRVDSLIRELDEFCGMASNPETVDLIQNERVAFGQIQLRAQLIVSFLMACQPHLKVVSR